ncbi:V/A-type H+-transporting ATPase subunit I [Marinilactibacillus piezotolerans]|uniref:V/A-type H+-transporting ATPase subunit I n=1 Tax=Marinilactibacillus piezotolerans TaxID=258723 RepID=A0A1I3VM70_9LACT|nr:V-type ATPase 116kDa subunit family protein [Marinilactibacillus piezotolerans]SFJ96179.1 V/A-type H+-transporting ATPase subunit I [Marinilactibacillus piezotolerans]
MAIAKMKKLTLMAEQQNKETLLRSIQEMQSIEVISLSDVLEEDILEQFEVADSYNETLDYKSELQDIEHALSYVSQFIPEPGMIEKLKTKREVLSLEELESHVKNTDIEGLINQVQDKEKEINHIEERKKALQEEETFLRKWRELKFLPSEVKGLKLLNVHVGTVDNEHSPRLIEGLDGLSTAYYEEIFSRSDEIAYMIILAKEQEEQFNKLTAELSFRELKYPFELLPEDALYANLNSQKALIEKEAALKKEMKEWRSVARDLQFAEEYYYNLGQREVAKDLVLNSKHLFIASGWIEEEKLDSLKHIINTDLGEDAVVVMTDDVKMEEFDQVPIVLHNNSVIRPFELITEMFSLPKYNEVDPTPLMFPFFLIFFGMIGADLGYGLLLGIGTFVALKLSGIEGSTRRFMKFLHILSYPTMAFGLFFGSFFGISLPFHVLSLQDDVIVVMVISVIIGVIQLIFGLIMNGIIKGRQGQRASSYVDGYAWAMMLIGLAIYVLGSIVFGIPLVSQIGIGLALINVVGIVVVSTISSKNKALGFGLGLYNLYGVTGYVGDIVSYTRLMALGVASANIAMAFNLIVGYLPPLFRFTIGVLLIIALQAMNVALSFLSAYVHSSRLQYVEFFGKFFEGGGKPLTPLKTLEKHIWLKQKI